MTKINLSYYKNKRILITGATGFIGSALIKKLTLASKKLICWNSSHNISNKNIWKEIITKVDIIFHLAAQTSSNLSNQQPYLDAKINLLPIINLIDTCRHNNVYPDIIYAGTVTEVGLTQKYPVNEEFKDDPITIYDINKLTAEKYLQYYGNQMKGRSVVLRLANVYGPGPASKKTDRGIVNLMIKKAMSGEDLTIYGKGNFIRDYIYIDDVINAFLLAGINIKSLNGNYYIIGSGQGNSIINLAKIIKKQVETMCNKRVSINNTDFSKSISLIELRNFIADSRLFTKITSWKPEYSLAKGINQTIKYYIT